MRHREIAQLCDSVGLRVLNLVQTRHVRAMLENRHGLTARWVFPCSESDRKAFENQKARLRRFARCKSIDEWRMLA